MTLVDKIIMESNQDEKAQFRQSRIESNKKIAEEHGYRTEGDFIFLYHGTSAVNFKKILKSAMFKRGTWFSPNEEVARKFGKMATKGKTQVMFALVYMGSLYFNGYFSSLEDLILFNGKYQPKGMRL